MDQVGQDLVDPLVRVLLRRPRVGDEAPEVRQQREGRRVGSELGGGGGDEVEGVRVVLVLGAVGEDEEGAEEGDEAAVEVARLVAPRLALGGGGGGGGSTRLFSCFSSSPGLDEKSTDAELA